MFGAVLRVIEMTVTSRTPAAAAALLGPSII